jgi:hypothetical protein
VTASATALICVLTRSARAIAIPPCITDTSRASTRVMPPCFRSTVVASTVVIPPRLTLTRSARATSSPPCSMLMTLGVDPDPAPVVAVVLVVAAAVASAAAIASAAAFAALGRVTFGVTVVDAASSATRSSDVASPTDGSSGRSFPVRSVMVEAYRGAAPKATSPASRSEVGYPAPSRGGRRERARRIVA